jgi:Dolichyl-phosphate-mannose-protein mannosyltransferase
MGLVRAIFLREINLRALYYALRDHPAEVIYWLGVLLRVGVYLWNREYWMDEGTLLGNVLGKRALDFSGYLNGDQLAPFGFLIVQRVISGLLGDSGYVTRFVPLVCGIVALWLFKSLSFRLLPSTAAMVALALFAFSDDLVYYSSELKPYSSDLALGLAITFATWRLLERPLRVGWLAALGLLVLLAPWFSFPSAFVIAGCGIALSIDRCAKRWWLDLGWLVVIGLCWLISFWLAYQASHALLHPATTMYVFWNFAFLPVPPDSRSDLIKLGGVLLEIFVNPLNVVAPLKPAVGVVLPVSLLLIGGVSLAVFDWRIFLILALPILMAIVAAGLRKYPLHGRLMIELVPAMYLMIAEGTQRLRTRLSRPAYLVLLVLLLGYPCSSTLYEAQAPRTRWFNQHGDLHANRFLP